MWRKPKNFGRVPEKIAKILIEKNEKEGSTEGEGEERVRQLTVEKTWETARVGSLSVWSRGIDVSKKAGKEIADRAILDAVCMLIGLIAVSMLIYRFSMVIA